MASAVAEGGRPPVSFHGAFAWAGYLLGFALGGFFDGILLHQILQWHHLLSAVDRPFLADLRAHILFDGLFHALMYVLAAIGLWLLWRARLEFARPGADRTLLAFVLIGFGVWHLFDAVAFHWVIGLHRIRMEAENVLLWDLVFFGLGAVVTAAGLLLLRSARADGDGGPPGAGRRPGGTAAAVLLTAVVLVAAPVSALPPPPSGLVAVVFAPGTTAREAFAAVAAADGRAVWSNEAGDLWFVQLDDPSGAAGALYRHGALMVRGSLFPIGCFASRPV